MRTKLLLIAAALTSVTASGCSVLFSGSGYQGGTGTDSGLPPVDMGTPVDTGMPPVDMGPGVDTGVPPSDAGPDAGAMPCAVQTDCMGDTFCLMAGSSGICTPCDADGDGYFSNKSDASPRCVRPAHPTGGDCDETMASVHPFARAVCTTAVVESCGIPALPTLEMITASEGGVSGAYTLFQEGGGYSLVGNRIGMSVGSDSPMTPMGTRGGFVAVGINSGTGGLVGAIPFALEGGRPALQDLFHGFAIGDFALALARNSAGSQELALAVTGSGSGTSDVAFTSMPLIPTPVAWAPPATGVSAAPLLLDGMGHSSVSIGDTLSGGAGFTLLDTGAAPAVGSFDPAVRGETGPANIAPSTWIASAGTGAMWYGGGSSICFWNGVETDGSSPPCMDFSAHTDPTGSIPQVLSPQFRAALAVLYDRSMPGLEHFVGAVPIGNTATPPNGGRVVLVRWSAMRPTSVTDRTDAVIPGGLQLHRLNVGAQFHAEAGVSLFALDGNNTAIAYRDGNDVVLRFISTGNVDLSMPEDPETIPMIHLAVGESVRGLVVAGGAYAADPRFPTGMAVGRIAVAAIVTRGTSPAEVRIASFELCIP